MIHGQTNAKTGETMAVLSDGQRNRLASVKTLLVELATFRDDPRAEHAMSLAEGLGTLLSGTTGLQDQKPKESVADASDHAAH